MTTTEQSSEAREAEDEARVASEMHRYADYALSNAIRAMEEAGKAHERLVSAVSKHQSTIEKLNDHAGRMTLDEYNELLKACRYVLEQDTFKLAAAKAEYDKAIDAVNSAREFAMVAMDKKLEKKYIAQSYLTGGVGK